MNINIFNIVSKNPDEIGMDNIYAETIVSA